MKRGQTKAKQLRMPVESFESSLLPLKAEIAANGNRAILLLSLQGGAVLVVIVMCLPGSLLRRTNSFGLDAIAFADRGPRTDFSRDPQVRLQRKGKRRYAF